MVDWRLPENRREAFMKLYMFVTEHRAHTEGTYFFLPAIVEHLGIQDDLEALAWVAWIDGNCQNPITTYLILEEAPTPEYFGKAREFMNTHYSKLFWDTDRRHQKSKFLEATEKLFAGLSGAKVHEPWLEAASQSSKAVWDYAISLPYMGRLSAWGLNEKMRFLLGHDKLPDIEDMMLEDVSGSHSYRNGLALIAGYEATFWENEAAKVLGIVDDLGELAESLLEEAIERSGGHPDVNRFTLESTLCMYKLMFKPRQRYPIAYIDRAYGQLLKAEKAWENPDELGFLYEALTGAVPKSLHPTETGGWDTKKTEIYRETGKLLHIDEDVK